MIRHGFPLSSTSKSAAVRFVTSRLRVSRTTALIGTRSTDDLKVGRASCAPAVEHTPARSPITATKPDLVRTHPPCKNADYPSRADTKGGSLTTRRAVGG